MRMREPLGPYQYGITSSGIFSRSILSTNAFSAGVITHVTPHPLSSAGP